MRIRKMPFLISKLYPKAWCTLPGAKQKTVYLTFDDGPHPEITSFVHDQLASHSAEGTFFLIGNNVQKYPTFSSEWYTFRGHAIGNHTFHHLNGFLTDNQRYFQNIQQCAQWVDSRLFRPPYGRMKFSQYRYLSQKYQIVLWDLVTYDWDKSVSPNSIVRHLCSNVRNGSIVVFHDSEKAWNIMSRALPEVLNFFSNEGWSVQKLEYQPTTQS